MYTSDDIYKQLANNQYINIDYWPHIFGLLSSVKPQTLPIIITNKTAN